MKFFDRREFIKVATFIGGTSLSAQAADGIDRDGDYGGASAILYDATRCIGCRSCTKQCRKVNNLRAETVTHNGTLFDMPDDLSDTTWSILQLYRKTDDRDANASEEWSFIKRNCMHCNVPSCATACPVQALRKTEQGPVTYDESRCIGCRYCFLACPHSIPRYEWLERMPRVRKCNHCGQCISVCPTGALQSGLRHDLLQEAHQRIKTNPQRYFNHIYGECEAGGTCYLIMAGVSPQNLGLPPLQQSTLSSSTDTIMRGMPGWIIGLGLLLGGMLKIQRSSNPSEEENDTQEN